MNWSKYPCRRLVISGGGADGVDVAAGCAAAVLETGFQPTEVHGTSAGALVGAMVAKGLSPGAILETVKALKDEDFRDERFGWKALMWLYDNAWHGQKAADLCRRIIGGRDGFIGTGCAYHAYASDCRTAEIVDVAAPGVCAGEVWKAALASMSVPFVFPPVRIGKRRFQDGGVSYNTPLPADNPEDAFTVVIIATGPRPMYKPARNMLRAGLTAFAAAIAGQTMIAEKVALARERTVVIHPLLAGRGGMLRFAHHLISRAQAFARQAMADAACIA
jgi:NTE family protein